MKLIYESKIKEIEFIYKAKLIKEMKLIYESKIKEIEFIYKPKLIKNKR